MTSDKPAPKQPRKRKRRVQPLIPPGQLNLAPLTKIDPEYPATKRNQLPIFDGRRYLKGQDD